ncbi:MAG: hypothetical protein Q8L27_02145, partial [archaeon]|nr:hypothetical protein [archaeon]
DYWGLSYKQALEYVLLKDNRSKIKIVVENMPGVYNSYILSEEEGARIHYVRTLEEADYLLTEYRWHNQDYAYPKYYSIEIERMEIMTVYQITK